MNKVLIIDNYDSFVYNIVHIITSLGYEVDVFRNDAISLADVAAYNKIVLSPGPGIPCEAGILLPLIEEYGATKSIFGICLGMQAMGEAYGSKLSNLSKVYHGVATPVTIIERDPIFEGIEDNFMVGRYHSWVVDRQTISSELVVTSVDDEQGMIMSLRHREHDVRGVQFHPESILTPEGEKIIKNWLEQ